MFQPGSCRVASAALETYASLFSWQVLMLWRTGVGVLLLLALTVCVKNRKMLQTVKRLRLSSFFAHFFGEAIQDASGFPSGVVVSCAVQDLPELV
jgi:hypothetical protein